jgi:hypothetical protein
MGIDLPTNLVSRVVVESRPRVVEAPCRQGDSVGEALRSTTTRTAGLTTSFSVR